MRPSNWVFRMAAGYLRAGGRKGDPYRNGTIAMSDETLDYLRALRKVNEALTDGLDTAVFVMEKWDELSPDRRRSMIGTLKSLVTQSRKIYGPEAAKH